MSVHYSDPALQERYDVLVERIDRAMMGYAFDNGYTANVILLSERDFYFLKASPLCMLRPNASEMIAEFRGVRMLLCLNLYSHESPQVAKMGSS